MKNVPMVNRVDDLESRQDNSDKTLNTLFDKFAGFAENTNDSLSALIAVFKDADVEFENKFMAKLNGIRLDKLKAKVEQEKKQIEHAVESGVLRASDAIGPNSLVIGRLWNKEGVVQEPGRVQISATDGFTSDEIKAKFVGQSAGYIYEAPTGEKLEVMEVYDLVPESDRPKPQVPQMEPMPPVAEVATETTATAS